MPAQIHILSAGAVQPGLSKVIEIFRRDSGDEVFVSFATGPAIAKRIAAGEMFDIAITPQQVIEELAVQEKIASESDNRATLGRIGVGVMIRTGAPLPNIATVEALKVALIGADSLV